MGSAVPTKSAPPSPVISNEVQYEAAPPQPAAKKPLSRIIASSVSGTLHWLADSSKWVPGAGGAPPLPEEPPLPVPPPGPAVDPPPDEADAEASSSSSPGEGGEDVPQAAMKMPGM